MTAPAMASVKQSRRRRAPRVALLIVVLGTIIVGCVQSRLDSADWNALTPAAKLYALQSEFNTALGWAKTYAERPFCDDRVAVACAEPKIVVRLDGLGRRGKVAIDGARAAVDRSEGDRNELLAVARSLVVQFSRELIAAGVGK